MRIMGCRRKADTWYRAFLPYRVPDHIMTQKISIGIFEIVPENMYFVRNGFCFILLKRRSPRKERDERNTDRFIHAHTENKVFRGESQQELGFHNVMRQCGYKKERRTPMRIKHVTGCATHRYQKHGSIVGETDVLVIVDELRVDVNLLNYTWAPESLVTQVEVHDPFFLILKYLL